MFLSSKQLKSCFESYIVYISVLLCLKRFLLVTIHLMFVKLSHQYCIVPRKGLRLLKQISIFCGVSSISCVFVQPSVETSQQNFQHLLQKETPGYERLPLHLLTDTPSCDQLWFHQHIGNHCIILFCWGLIMNKLGHTKRDWLLVIFW